MDPEARGFKFKNRYDRLCVLITVIVIVTSCVMQSYYKGGECLYHLRDGYWANDGEWLSHHCIMHQYQKEEISDCLERWDHTVLIGSSKGKKYFNLLNENAKTKLEFQFRAELKSQEYQHIMSRLKDGESLLIIHKPETFLSYKDLEKDEIASACKEKLLSLLKAQEAVLKAVHRRLIILLSPQQEVMDARKEGCLAAAQEIYSNQSFPLLYINLPVPYPPTSSAVPQEMNIILNSFCNTPLNATCCVKQQFYFNMYLATSSVIAVLALCLGFYLVLATGATFALTPHLEARSFDLQKFISFIYSVGVIAAGFLYMQMVERLDYFTRVSVSPQLMLCGILLLGIGVLTVLSVKETDQKEVLSHSQCYEWRGLMMVLFVVLDYAGIDEETLNSRVINHVAGVFLFLSGYGHFINMWNEENVSWKKSVRVLVNLNFVPLCVCILLGNPYGMYILPPLLSLSYIFVLTFMTLWPAGVPGKSPTDMLSDAHVKVGVKFLTSLVLLLLLPSCKNIIIAVMNAIPFLQSSDRHTENLYEWIETQRFTPLFGMAMAYFVITIKSKFISSVNQCQYNLNVMAIISGLLMILMYLMFLSKISATNFQSLLGIFPIISYILLRNGIGFLRNYHSSFLKMLGTISIWLFVSHYHILKALNGKGILVLLPRLYTLNYIFVIAVFIGVTIAVGNSLYTLKEIKSLKHFFSFVNNV